MIDVKKMHVILLLFGALCLMTGCSSIQSESEVLTESFSDDIPWIKTYYSYMKTPGNSQGAFIIRKKGKAFYLSGGTTENEYSAVIRARLVSSPSTGPWSYFGQAEFGGTIYLFPFEAYSNKFVVYENPRVDAIEKNSRLRTSPLRNLYEKKKEKSSSDLVFSKRAALDYKQEIISFVSVLREGDFSKKLDIKEATSDEVKSIWKKNKIIAEKKKAEEDLAKTQDNIKRKEALKKLRKEMQ